MLYQIRTFLKNTFESFELLLLHFRQLKEGLKQRIILANKYYCPLIADDRRTFSYNIRNFSIEIDQIGPDIFMNAVIPESGEFQRFIFSSVDRPNYLFEMTYAGKLIRLPEIGIAKRYYGEIR